MSLNDIRSRREEILAIAARYGASQVRVFGSISRGEETPASDVDLLVHLDENRTLLDQIALIHALEDFLGCHVDVVDDEAVHPILREDIMAEVMDL
ncbi:MAG: nucleotidyltransferase family protein [Phycisphaerae bacterium]|nr:nucleotidyltransferase family protein [Phycisphaerae bacterium]